ncbi:MAG: aldehyde dehydrogenase family protein [Candidatus Lloydbacteria bacterium]|nr:aldehyde dehydrogenase family protein [Candidatus Lloydbacteria bacterium]
MEKDKYLGFDWMRVHPWDKENTESLELCLENFVDGKWTTANKTKAVVSPLDGTIMFQTPDTKKEEIAPFVSFLNTCPEGGLHNPFKNTERYRQYGLVFAKAANLLSSNFFADYFARLIQCVMPKSYAQAYGEVAVTRDALYNLSGDGVRFCGEWKGVPGDRLGQRAEEHRFPHGPVVIIAPFNFPLEIPALQLAGALAMGNKVLIKGASAADVVIEQFIRMLLSCGMPKNDVALIHCDGITMEEIIKETRPAMTQFTGSSKVAQRLTFLTRGKIKIEDSGFNWKILGPDCPYHDHHLLEYVAWQCDQDAYAASGQKCSAQSLLFMHANWKEAGIIDKIAEHALQRNLDDLTIGPLLSVRTKDVLLHIEALSHIKGFELLFGGKPLGGHFIPEQYGAMEPTAVSLPLNALSDHEIFRLVTQEIFGPFQIIVEYKDTDMPEVLNIIKKIKHKLTAAIVSDNIPFINQVVGASANGTTYAGYRARTTGAPEWHGFHPAGVLAANIGTIEAIREVWSYGRTIVFDNGSLPNRWELVQT